jgi:hypothetical protein
MPAVNLFQKLMGQVSPKPETAPVSDEPKADWLSEPVAIRQKIAIHRFFLRKNLAVETDPAWLAKFEELCNFDPETGYWAPPVGFTKGEARELQQRLYELPYKKSSEKTSSKLSTKAPSASPKPPAATNGNSVPDGWEIRHGKKGPYLAKAK